MKVEAKRDVPPKTYEPITVTITIESLKEAELLTQMLGYDKTIPHLIRENFPADRHIRTDEDERILSVLIGDIYSAIVSKM